MEGSARQMSIFRRNSKFDKPSKPTPAPAHDSDDNRDYKREAGKWQSFDADDRRRSWWEGEDDDYYVPSRPAKRESLSSFWGDRFGGWRDWASSTLGGKATIGASETFQFVHALQSVARVGRIVFNDAIKFSWNKNVAYVNSGSDGVGLDKQPLEAKDISWSDGKRVDALMGSALSDAGQLRHTTLPELDGYLENRARFVAVAHARSEEVLLPAAKLLAGSTNYLSAVAQIVEEFPGYAGYFETDREFRHRGLNRNNAQKTIDNALAQSGERSFAAAVLATLWNAVRPEEPLNAGPALEELVSKTASTLREQARAARTHKAQCAATIDALDALAELEDPEQSSEEQSQLTQAKGASDDARLGNPHQSKQGLEDGEAERIASYSELELTEHDTKERLLLPANNYHGEPIPLVSLWQNLGRHNEYDSALQDVRNLIQRTRASLSFRNEISRMDEYGLRSGLLDEGGMAAIATGSPSVFRRQDIVSAPAVHIGIMVDESGSMGGEGEETARRVTILLHEACKSLPGVAVSVWGHTANYGEAPDGCLVYRYLERGAGEPRTLGEIHGRCQNIDGAAIAYAGKRMRELARPGESAILFVLADGQPAGWVGNRNAYGRCHYTGTHHTRECIEHVRRSGTNVFCLGMGGCLRPMDLTKMYGENGWIHCPNPEDLPAALARLLKRVLRTGAL
jgi:hypothetical protein